jgi:EAL domain-containing protein (putative c-di-GMP-specific phosphodiesterase class I)
MTGLVILGLRQTTAIVSSIVGLGQSLNVIITAEGVETEAQAAMLKEWGCDEVQGYYRHKLETDGSEDNEASKKLDRPLVA